MRGQGITSKINKIQDNCTEIDFFQLFNFDSVSDEEWTAVVDQYPVVVNEAFSEEPDHRSGDKKTGMFYQTNWSRFL